MGILLWLFPLWASNFDLYHFNYPTLIKFHREDTKGFLRRIWWSDCRNCFVSRNSPCHSRTHTSHAINDVHVATYCVYPDIVDLHNRWPGGHRWWYIMYVSTNDAMNYCKRDNFGSYIIKFLLKTLWNPFNKIKLKLGNQNEIN